MYSDIALKIYTLVIEKAIKSKTQFWKEFNDLKKINSTKIDTLESENKLKSNNLSLICCFDKDFPKLSNISKKSEKPFLLVYKGNVSLLNNKNNVAIVGEINPNKDIEAREINLVKALLKQNKVIVSGLAKGCDTIAHKCCVENQGKTIAILPTTFDNIYPKENKDLLNEIVCSGGLVISEYAIEPKNRNENISRFIERDRLQAMFSESVILVASYRKGEGDSGARHAIQKAKEYGKQRFVMYNKSTDYNIPSFGLNQDLVNEGVKIINDNNVTKA